MTDPENLSPGERRNARRRRRRDFMHTWSLPAAFVVIVVGVLLQQFQANEYARQRLQVANELQAQTEKLTVAVDGVHKILGIVVAVTGKDAQNANAAKLREAVRQLGCDNRAALQEALDALADQGVIRRVVVVCPPPSTTTTFLAPGPPVPTTG